MFGSEGFHGKDSKQVSRPTRLSSHGGDRKSEVSLSGGATAAVPFAQPLAPVVGVTVGAATAHYTDTKLDDAYEKYVRDWLVNVGVSGLNKGRDIFETVGRGVDSISDWLNRDREYRPREK